MDDPLDIDLEDRDLQEEIRLVSELMADAAASAAPLTQERIDQVLTED